MPSTPLPVWSSKWLSFTSPNLTSARSEASRAALLRAFEEAELVLLKARCSFGLSPQTIYLRRVDDFGFEALIPILEDEFASDKMLGLLEKAGEREEEFESEPFSVSFRFLPLGPAMRGDLIYGDGFEFTYTRYGPSVSGL